MALDNGRGSWEYVVMEATPQQRSAMRHPNLRPGLAVYWKDEGGQGPLTVIDPDAQAADPEYHPLFASPNADDYTIELGWTTAAEAERTANFCGTDVIYS